MMLTAMVQAKAMNDECVATSAQPRINMSACKICCEPPTRQVTSGKHISVPPCTVSMGALQ